MFKWLAAIYIILIFNLLNALGFLIITSVYFYNTEKADTTLELTLVLLTTTLVLMNTSTDAFRAFVQAVRENVVIHDKLQSSTNYDESVKFRVAELFETNK
jgi:hypothetical protein